jgi:YHS domain-containing protein
MRRSDLLGRLTKVGTAGALATMLAASAEAALPTGGMLLSRPRGPARADLPCATAISAIRVPSAIAYGIVGGPAGSADEPEAIAFANEAPAEPTELIPEEDTSPVITPRTALTDADPFAPPAPSEWNKIAAANPFGPAPVGEDPTPPAEEPSETAVAQETPPPAIATEPVSVEPELAEYAGLKGICPVTLRDERRVVEPKPELVSMHAGRRYEFATADAKAMFDANPDRYAPALGGRDVVLTAQGAEEAIGSLKFAGYYHGRLYLFQSDETYRAFYESPKRYGVGD